MEENTTNITTSIDIQNVDGIEYLKTIGKNSISPTESAITNSQ